MQQEPAEKTSERGRTKWAAAMLAGVYLAATAAAAWLGHPLTTTGLVLIALIPAVATAAAGLPKITKPGPRALLALFHLGLFPLLAALAAGIPAAALAWAIRESLGPV